MSSARGVALRALQQLDKGRIERVGDEIARAALEPRDLALARELALGAVRNERFLDFVLERFVTRSLPKDPRTRSALRLGAFQLLLLDGMPQRAAVHETVGLLQRDKAFANAVLRRVADAVASRAADPARPAVELPLSPRRALLLPEPGLGAAAEPLAVRHSLPDFLVARWRAAHGCAAVAGLCEAASGGTTLFLRACGGRTGAALIELLAAEAVRCEPTPHPLVVRCLSGAPFATRAAAAGAFVAQDPTAVAAAEAVGAVPGMRILDLCAAPGTKATLLAERVQPDGVVFAFDPDTRRRERIVDNARRLGLERTLRIVEDPQEAAGVDAVLADVPCSNTGVLSRRVEVRRRLEPGTFAAMAAVQRPILAQALRLVRPGGAVVYSTCSIEPEENGEVARAVAAEHGWRVVAELATLPAADTCDGGYWALLREGADGG
ncbi:MAG: transcription antitermination factor NusB [Planctomycetota bacterium]